MTVYEIEQEVINFHNTYENNAKKYGYETRKDTKELDLDSPNGRTMIATVFEILQPYTEKIEKLEEENKKLNNRIHDITETLNETYNNRTELRNENERLKNGYCELKVKCNNGECDCTHEEYNEMCKQNMKMDLEIERLNNIINELEKYFDEELENLGYREEKLYTQGIHDTIIDHKYRLRELKRR